MSDRLELLHPYLSRYTRRFSVLDLGAGIETNQNVGCEIAKEFDAVVVSIEKDIVAPPPSSHTMWLKSEFTTFDLNAMSECEHFDVVLAFNLLHWYSDWEKALEVLFRMSNHLFIQIPKPEDVTAPNAEELPKMLDVLQESMGYVGETVQFPGHRPRPIYYRYQDRRTLSKTHVDAHDHSATTIVMASPDKSTAFLKGDMQEWKPGINLYNFLRWRGIYPSREAIIELLRSYPLPVRRHGDITAHNFIFDGDSLHLVDGGDGWIGDSDQTAMNKTIEYVKNYDILS